MKIPLLDLFCGAGGCAKGYSLTNHFDPIIGIDIEYQPRYPFQFIQDDVFSFIKKYDIGLFGLIHASPPCQAYTWSNHSGSGDPLIKNIREILINSDSYYVIENVKTKQLINPLRLNGTMFGLNTIRERWFESNFPITQPPIYKIRSDIKRNGKQSQYVTCAGQGGHGSNRLLDWSRAMQINWMTKEELTQAIPPAYTQYIGKEFINYLGDINGR